MKNYYHTLNLQNFASLDEIRRAYRKLALVHHPDRGGDVEKMKEIEAIAAWQEYSDEVKMREDQKFVISTIERIKQELIKRNEALDELEENKDEK